MLYRVVALYLLGFPPQVILRLLDPSSSKILDPYSPEAVARLALTNLRIRLRKAQTCPDPAETSSTASALTSDLPITESTAAAPYAVYTLLARGTCLCHGHAGSCAPHNNSGDTSQDQNMVNGFSFEFKSKVWVLVFTLARLQNLECMFQAVTSRC